jgi:hypothetical protein
MLTTGIPCPIFTDVEGGNPKPNFNIQPMTAGSRLGLGAENPFQSFSTDSGFSYF